MSEYDYKPSLRDIYTAGTPLAEVDPGARGLPYRVWEKLELDRQCEEWRKAGAVWPDRATPTDAIQPRKGARSEWHQRAAATGRDNYGWRSL